MAPKPPTIKFLKSATNDILAGKKTLEPRPRNLNWIKRIEKANIVHFTYGPRMGAPTIFAVAKIQKVELRAFNTATADDLVQIAYGWEHRKISDFIQEYSDWYAKELAKGYPVAWIYFELCKEDA